VCVFARNKLSETRKNKNGDIIIQGESLLKQAGVKIKGCWMGLEKKKERFTSFFFPKQNSLVILSLPKKDLTEKNPLTAIY